ncbi:MAG: ATP-binding protein [Burkholderiales bacterium]
MRSLHWILRPLLHLPLYLRLWLAVVLAVALLTALVGFAWRYSAEPPLRDAVLFGADGQTVIGRGRSLPRGPGRSANAGARIVASDASDATDTADEIRAAAKEAAAVSPLSERLDVLTRPPPTAAWGAGPAFVLQMNDGQVAYVHLPRPAGRSFWNRPPFGFFWMLALVGIGVALATYPIVRKLTRGLERLQRGVEQLGDGDLTTRVPVVGHDETAFLARRFNHAAERIEALVAAHKSLLANASHELRSPLARIRMGLELMGASPSPALRSEIARSVAELDQLIDEILLASRLDAREADVGTVEPVELIALAAEECAQAGAELDVQQNAVVVPGVPRLLRRALRNLLENARRYASSDHAGSAGDGSVLVSVSVQQSAAGMATITVSDRGPGVPALERTRIFEPFYRMRGASERHGGVGLGLALVKSIAERHGGGVRCEDRPGGGARFVIELPGSARVSN